MPLSIQIQKLAESDDFHLADTNLDLQIDFSSSKRKLILSLNINSGLIEDFSYQGSPSTFEKAIYEAFGRLNKNSFFWAVRGLNKREMKNYLQDTNDNAPFSEEYENEFDEVLSQFPVLISKIFIKKALQAGEKLNIITSEKKEFGDLIHQMKSYYQDIIEPLMGKDCSLGDICQWDAPNLIVLRKMEQSPIPNDLINSIEEIYKTVFQISDFKVVAVEEKYI